mmetsp:Transcript_30566/g.93538  ORF Transcript_30566/g.93538 Transcript_30566/m.93538 type:complete len:122 (-) Transcript_30566:1730-2095(-)
MGDIGLRRPTAREWIRDRKIHPCCFELNTHVTSFPTLNMNHLKLWPPMKITIGAKRSRTQNEKLFAQPRAPPLRNHGISRGPSGRLRGSSNGAGHPYDGLSGPSDLSKPSEGLRERVGWFG